MRGKGKIENGKWHSGGSFPIFQFPVSIFRQVGWWLRQVSGDAAYENYLRAVHGDGECARQHRLMTREEFYLDHLRRRYTGISRCC